MIAAGGEKSGQNSINRKNYAKNQKKSKKESWFILIKAPCSEGININYLHFVPQKNRNPMDLKTLSSSLNERPCKNAFNAVLFDIFVLNFE